MKIAFYLGDEEGCGMYRCRYPAQAAEEQALIEFTTAFEVQTRRYMRTNAVEPVELDADLVVFQRPAHRETVEIIRGFQRQGTPVLVDLDDDFGAIPTQHPAWGKLDPKRSPNANWEWTKKAASLADLLTTSTPALAERYGRHDRVVVVPNCVPASLLDLPRESEGKTIGWAGWVRMHPGDLETVQGGVAEALRGSSWRFKVVGPSKDVKTRLALDSEPEATGGLPIDDYHRALGSFDIGIVPLAPNRFNEAKSWLKGLEYAAVGVPFVASPTPAYQALARGGIGCLAGDRGRHWRSGLRRLMEDAELRANMAEKAKQVVADRHTYEANTSRWMEAWERAAARRRALQRAA